MEFCDVALPCPWLEEGKMSGGFLLEFSSLPALVVAGVVAGGLS
jgi:hypothetical protein